MPKKKKAVTFLLATLAILTVSWTILTWVAQKTGPGKNWIFGNDTAGKKVLIVFDPDPFYNLDEQLCRSFAEVLADNNMRVHIATVAAAKDLKTDQFDVLVFCANTYNWSPDWAITDYISEQRSLNNKPVVAITLGAGATEVSQQIFEQLIKEKGGNIIDSRAFWLMRPNDEARVKQPNVQVALSKVRKWAESVAIRL